MTEHHDFHHVLDFIGQFLGHELVHVGHVVRFRPHHTHELTAEGRYGVETMRFTNERSMRTMQRWAEHVGYRNIKARVIYEGE
jgi:hypothetical protein